MTNQDTEEPQVHAHLGVVRIPAGSCCEGQRWEEYTPDAASKLTVAISVAIRDARDQLRAIAEACADGHAWNSGINWTISTEKITLYRCTREGCEGYDERPGWLPFEPKQHLVPYSQKLWDCTGPGCEWCDAESFGAAFRKIMADGVKQLDATLFADPKPATGGIVTGLPYRAGERDNCYPLTAADLKAARDRLLANPWPRGELVDEDPERTTEAGFVQFGDHRIPIIVNPDMPEGELLVVGSCSCKHPVTSHRSDGCHHRTTHCDTCPCQTDVATLTTKTTGTGETP